MKCIEEASSLKINKNKSKVYGVGVTIDDVECLAGGMGCAPGKFPFT